MSTIRHRDAQFEEERMKSCLGRVVLGLVVGALVGCGGGDGDGDNSPADVVAADSVGDLATVDVPEPEDIAPQCPSSNWVMEFFGITDGMTIETGETMLLQARIFDSALAKTVEGAEVTFSLSGSGDAKFLETTALTSDLGVAAVSFSTGTDLGVTYTIKAANPCTEDQVVTLSTVAPEQGSFMITYSLSAELTETWEQLTVVAYADNTIPLCGAVDYTKPGSQGVELPAGESTIEFTQIQANAAYVVFGIAYNPDGVPVGGGCTEGVSVLPDMTTDAEVAIESLAMNPAGGYDLTVQVAAKDLMALQWIDAGAALDQIIGDSGQTIGQKVLDDILIFFPDGLPDCGDMDAAADIQASIDAGLENLDTANIDWLAANADQWLNKLLANVTFKGKLMVEESAENQTWTATWSTESMEFSGPIDCSEDTCDSWLLFAPETFGLGDVHVDLSQEVFDLVATGFAELAVQPFDLPIAPGKLVLFALNNIVLKERGLSNEVVELFDTTFNCSALMAQVSAQTIACINKPQTQLIESCESAVDGMAADFYGAMAAFTAEQHLATAGTLTSVDDNNDLTVDSITGNFEGDFLLGGETEATFMLPFVAVKK
jgi:hypothetical protein